MGIIAIDTFLTGVVLAGALALIVGDVVRSIWLEHKRKRARARKISA